LTFIPIHSFNHFRKIFHPIGSLISALCEPEGVYADTVNSSHEPDTLKRL
jgi:hypothetical protein